MTHEYDIVIVGGGITGLTAAMMAARLGRSTLVLTGKQLGGHLLSIEKIEGYPGYPDGVAGYELCPMTQEQAVAAGAEIEMDSVAALEPVEECWKLTVGRGVYLTKTVIVATGTTMKRLGIPGAERFVGRGVSHCASCDAPLLRERPVVVIGGGDSALQEALTLAEVASEVSIFHCGEKFSAQACFQKRVSSHDKITTRFNVQAQEVLGEDGVEGVRFRHGEETFDHMAAGVFIYIGLAPNTELLNGLVALDTRGGVLTDGLMRTRFPGLLAAGTARSGATGKAVAAAGEGMAAALSADRYIACGDWTKMQE